MGRTTNCLALIRLPARLRERETPGIATNTTLALLWLVGDATSNASYTVPCLRCTWAWFARALCWLAARRHRAAPAQHGRSDHGAPHAAPATTRGLLLVYVVYAAVSVRFCFASWQELRENRHRTRIYCDDHTRIGCSLTSSRGSSLDLHYFSRHCDVHQLRICTVSTHQNVLMRDGTLIICGTRYVCMCMYVCMYIQ